MKTSGSLIMLVMFALIVLIGISASSDMIGEASGSNDAAAAHGAEHIVSPIFQVMGFGVLIIGILITINALN